MTYSFNSQADTTCCKDESSVQECSLSDKSLRMDPRGIVRNPMTRSTNSLPASRNRTCLVTRWYMIVTGMPFGTLSLTGVNCILFNLGNMSSPKTPVTICNTRWRWHVLSTHDGSTTSSVRQTLNPGQAPYALMYHAATWGLDFVLEVAVSSWQSHPFQIYDDSSTCGLLCNLWSFNLGPEHIRFWDWFVRMS